MLKLARNLLSLSPVKLPGFKTTVKSKHITAFFKFKNEVEFRLGPRLTRHHAYFERHKMKAALAAQVLSRSVEDALRNAPEVLKIPRVNLNHESLLYVAMN